MLEPILYGLLALPISSQVPYELLALVKIELGKLTLHCASASLTETCNHVIIEQNHGGGGQCDRDAKEQNLRES